MELRFCLEDKTMKYGSFILIGADALEKDMQVDF